MLAGRTFTEDDRFGARPVVIVNATFARRYFPNRSALGARIVPGISEQGDKTDPARTIVGVVADLRSSLTKAPEPTIYLPIRQVPLSDAFLVLRTRGAAPLAAAAAEITNLDPLLATPAVEPLGSYVAESVATQRLSVAALSALAFVALALSIAGVFAVVSYGVTQRTHEFGVRMALGAQAQTIVRTVLGGALRLAAYGIVLGLLIAGAGTRLVADQLYETQPLDPLTFVIVTALVTFAALLAALIPARRATRVDPIVALRYE
jgi:putative ABC transport system permease protein